MAELRDKDVIVIKSKKDLEHAIQRIKDQHDGNMYYKPKIFTKRELLRNENEIGESAHDMECK